MNVFLTFPPTVKPSLNQPLSGGATMIVDPQLKVKKQRLLDQHFRAMQRCYSNDEYQAADAYYSLARNILEKGISTNLANRQTLHQTSANFKIRKVYKESGESESQIHDLMRLASEYSFLQPSIFSGIFSSPLYDHQPEQVAKRLWGSLHALKDQWPQRSMINRGLLEQFEKWNGRAWAQEQAFDMVEHPLLYTDRELTEALRYLCASCSDKVELFLIENIKNAYKSQDYFNYYRFIATERTETLTNNLKDTLKKLLFNDQETSHQTEPQSHRLKALLLYFSPI